MSWPDVIVGLGTLAAVVAVCIAMIVRATR